MKESESFFTSNVSGPNSAVLITDLDGRIVYVSPNIKDVVGVHCEEFSFLNRVLDQLRTIGQNELAGREIFVTKDQVIVLDDSDGTSLVLIADVHEIALDGCHRLITIRKVNKTCSKGKPEEQTELIAESADSYNIIADHAPISICVITEDRFTYVNQAWEGFTGYCHSESLKLDPFSLVHPRMRDMMLQRKQDDLAGKTVPVRYDLIILDKQQQERWADVSIVRMMINGERIIILYAIDITVRKQAEFAYKQSEIRMRHIMDSTVEAIVGLDQEGLFTFINKSGIDLLGYGNSDEFFGQNMHQLIHHSKPDGSYLPGSECVHLKALQDKKTVHTSDIVFWRKDGSSFPASCRLQPIVLDGQPAGGVLTFLDISEQINANLERKRLEEQLRHYQKMEAIGTLAGGIAHDFNNILGGIIGYGEMMEMFEMEDQAEMLEKVGRILQAAYRAKDLVNQILAFSRKVSVEFDTVHLIPLIKETLILLRASFPSSITIETSFTVENDTIYADPTQIHQVLLNLCSNAADSMKIKGGTLAISLRETEGVDTRDDLPGEQLQGSWLLLEIKDTGHGFSPDLADRIFDPYFTTKKVGEGTGMGLALVYGIVGVHSGFISAESQPEVGSVFRVFLPQYTSIKEPPEVETFVAASGGTGRILFVDDEEDLVLINKEMLSKLGYNVTATTSSNEAFDCFSEAPQSFDLVITDETMPGITGTELALKIHDIRNNIPIILCTGNSTALSQDKIQEAGIMDVLRKPVSINVLARIIKKILV